MCNYPLNLTATYEAASECASCNGCLYGPCGYLLSVAHSTKPFPSKPFTSSNCNNSLVAV